MYAFFITTFLYSIQKKKKKQNNHNESLCWAYAINLTVQFCNSTSFYSNRYRSQAKYKPHFMVVVHFVRSHQHVHVSIHWLGISTLFSGCFVSILDWYLSYYGHLFRSLFAMKMFVCVSKMETWASSTKVSCVFFSESAYVRAKRLARWWIKPTTTTEKTLKHMEHCISDDNIAPKDPV